MHGCRLEDEGGLRAHFNQSALACLGSLRENWRSREIKKA